MDCNCEGHGTCNSGELLTNSGEFVTEGQDRVAGWSYRRVYVQSKIQGPDNSHEFTIMSQLEAFFSS